MMETVAQIATPPGTGGISIIKISGADSIKLTNSIFKGKDLEKVGSHTLNYGHIFYDNKIIDEVLISVMRAPNSYTGEDVVEINCHGGLLITQKILQILITNNVKLASAGEFTKRAFLNGKKSMNEVQTIMDLISSKNEEALNLAINSLNVSSKNLIEQLRQKLLNIVSNIEVNIDYPEYEDLKVIKNADIKIQIDDFINLCQEIISDSKSGEIIKNGLNTVILGKPNVGKSSILNYLAKADKAIVTHIEGTTRDTIESEINLYGLTLNLIDTAGIRKTNDIVENIGINKSIDQIEKSDLVMIVLDNSTKLNDDEYEIFKTVTNSNKKFIIIINKSDEKSNLDLNSLNLNDAHTHIINMSAKEQYGDRELAHKIKELFDLQYFDSQNSKYIANLENISKLEIILTNMMKIKEDLQNDTFLDLVLIDLKDSLFILSELLGLNPKEDYLNEMFSRFCLGK